MFVVKADQNRVKRFWSQFEKQQRHFPDVLRQLKKVPHLPLNSSVKIDLEKLKRELLQVQSWHPHILTSSSISRQHREFHSKSYKGQTFYDCIDDNLIGMSDTPTDQKDIERVQFDEGGVEIYFPTPLGRQMPHAVEIMESFGPPRRCRVIKTPPGGGIDWHSHHQGPYFQKDYCTVSVVVTIETNLESIHSVRMVQDHSRYLEKNYEAGSAYVFNSWEDHCFWNKGRTDRICLIGYYSPTSAKLLQNLQENLRLYEGNYFEK